MVAHSRGWSGHPAEKVLPAPLPYCCPPLDSHEYQQLDTPVSQESPSTDVSGVGPGIDARGRRATSRPRHLGQVAAGENGPGPVRHVHPARAAFRPCRHSPEERFRLRRRGRAHRGRGSSVHGFRGTASVGREALPSPSRSGKKRLPKAYANRLGRRAARRWPLPKNHSGRCGKARRLLPGVAVPADRAPGLFQSRVREDQRANARVLPTGTSVDVRRRLPAVMSLPNPAKGTSPQAFQRQPGGLEGPFRTAATLFHARVGTVGTLPPGCNASWNAARQGPRNRGRQRRKPAGYVRDRGWGAGARRPRGRCAAGRRRRRGSKGGTEEEDGWPRMVDVMATRGQKQIVSRSGEREPARSASQGAGQAEALLGRFVGACWLAKRKRPRRGGRRSRACSRWWRAGVVPDEEFGRGTAQFGEAVRSAPVFQARVAEVVDDQAHGLQQVRRVDDGGPFLRRHLLEVDLDAAGCSDRPQRGLRPLAALVAAHGLHLLSRCAATADCGHRRQGETAPSPGPSDQGSSPWWGLYGSLPIRLRSVQPIVELSSPSRAACSNLSWPFLLRLKRCSQGRDRLRCETSQ
jgi:hypothetical protein